MSEKKLYGLIGYRLSHSFSKKYFSLKFKNENIVNCEYRNFEICDINLLKNVIENNKNLRAFNVTIPYKESIIPFLDNISKEAKEIGAVNTVYISKIKENVKLTGYNTDYKGFKISLQKVMKGNEKNALILGSGGASKAVQYAFRQLGINYTIVSRKSENKKTISYNQISKAIMEQTEIIVNTTPLGMFPNIDDAPHIPYQYIKKGIIVYDLIYNPKKTLFLQKAEAKGAVICNGLKMLELQAEEAWNIFNKH